MKAVTFFFAPEGGGGLSSESDLSTHVQAEREGIFLSEIDSESESRCSTFFPPLAAFCGSVGPVCRDIDPIAARAFSGSQR